jgi:hypothetical protein
MIKFVRYIGHHSIEVTIILLQVDEILHFGFVPVELYLEVMLSRHWVVGLIAEHSKFSVVLFADDVDVFCTRHYSEIRSGHPGMKRTAYCCLHV